MDTSCTTPSYTDLLARRGRELAVVAEPCRLVPGTVLVLEEVSTPWCTDGFLHYEAVFTGPVADELRADVYRVRDGETTYALRLEPVARDVRHVHYVASLAEVSAVPAEPMPLAG